MLEEHIENGAFDLKELEEDLFATAYQDCTFDYSWSRDPDRDYENARYVWNWDSLFEQTLRERLEDAGYRASDGHARGRFVWIREFDLLMVCPGSEAVPDATLSFNRLEIDDIEFATGVVRDGLFYLCKTATKVIV
jgi:hypothetical protein